MNKIKIMLVVMLFVFSSCSPEEGPSGDDSTPASETTTTSSTSSSAKSSIVGPGPECTYGGIRVDTGIDDNRNGILDDSEIDNSEYVCNGAPGSDGSALNSIVSIQDESAGSNCIYGGVRIETGLDDNSNDVLDSAEIDMTKYICNGSPGVGAAGLIIVTDEPSGVNCSSGGKKIETGLDNGDGTGTENDAILQPDEIDSTEYVCNGTDGANGNDGFTNLISITDESPGSNCNTGGKKIETGLDNGDGAGTAEDTVLHADEVDSVQYICNGLDGNDGTNGVDGTNSLVEVNVEPSGSNCTFGGQKITSGLDNGEGGGTADDNILQTGEIDSTAYVCEIPSFDALIKTTEEPIGLNCPYGGNKLEIGLDNGDGGGTASDGILQAGEVDSVSYSCHADNIHPAVISINPTDASTDIDPESEISVTFNESMDTSTITVNTLTTDCTGTIQLSNDGFDSCVQFASDPTYDSERKVITMTPSTGLSFGSRYNVRVLPEIKDTNQNSLYAQYQTSTGFMTLGVKLVDDFNSGAINEDVLTKKEDGPGSSASVINGEVQAIAGNDPSDASGHTGVTFINTDFQAFQAKVKIDSFSESRNDTRVRLEGFAYDTGPRDWSDITGEMWVGLRMFEDGVVSYYICHYDDASTCNIVASGYIDTVDASVFHTLSMGFDGNDFYFQLDGLKTIIVPVDKSQYPVTTPGWGYAGVRARHTGDYTGTMTALIDDIKIGTVKDNTARSKSMNKTWFIDRLEEAEFKFEFNNINTIFYETDYYYIFHCGGGKWWLGESGTYSFSDSILNFEVVNDLNAGMGFGRSAGDKLSWPVKEVFEDYFYVLLSDYSGEIGFTTKHQIMPPSEYTDSFDEERLFVQFWDNYNISTIVRDAYDDAVRFTNYSYSGESRYEDITFKFARYNTIQADLKLLSATNNSWGKLELRLDDYGFETDISASLELVKDNTNSNLYILVKINYHDENDNYSVIYSNVIGDAAFNTTYTFKIEKNGNTVNFYVDGSLVDTYTFDSSYVISGHPGRAEIATYTSNGSHIVMTADNFIAKDPSF